MPSAIRVLLVSAVFPLLGLGCLPPLCDGPVPPRDVCHVADAGPLAPDASFVLEADVSVIGGQCDVSVDGGQIELFVTGGSCASGGPNGIRAPGSTVRCTIPPLAAGNYVVNTQLGSGFTVADVGDAGIRRCF